MLDFTEIREISEVNRKFIVLSFSFFFLQANLPQQSVTPGEEYKQASFPREIVKISPKSTENKRTWSSKLRKIHKKISPGSTTN